MMRALVATAARTLRVGKSELPTINTLGELKVVLSSLGGSLVTALVAKTATFTGILDTLSLGRYNLSPPTLTDGDVQLLQLDASGNQRVTEQFQPASNFINITAATTTVVKSGSGRFARLIVNTIVGAATITIYDNTAASGTKIGILTLPAAGAGDMPGNVEFGCAFANGLTVVTSGATDLTVVWD